MAFRFKELMIQTMPEATESGRNCLLESNICVHPTLFECGKISCWLVSKHERCGKISCWLVSRHEWCGKISCWLQSMPPLTIKHKEDLNILRQEMRATLIHLEELERGDISSKLESIEQAEALEGRLQEVLVEVARQKEQMQALRRRQT